MEALPSHPGAGPFVLGEAGAPKVALFHGLTGAPSELWPLGLALANAGYRVEAPLWLGHGATPEDLAQRSAEDLLQQARSIASDPEITAFAGLSMGALLALLVVSERPETKALVLMAPALRLHGRNRLFIEAMRLPGLARLPLMIPKGQPETAGLPVLEEPAGHYDPLEREAAHIAEAAPARPGADGRYDRIPVRWGRELHHLQTLTRAAADRISCPVLLMHGLGDRTASPSGSLELATLVRGPVCTRFFAASPHVMMLGPERGAVAAEAVRFLTPLVPPRLAGQAALGF